MHDYSVALAQAAPVRVRRSLAENHSYLLLAAQWVPVRRPDRRLWGGDIKTADGSSGSVTADRGSRL